MADEKYAICVTFGPSVINRKESPLAALVNVAHVDPRRHDGFVQAGFDTRRDYHLSFIVMGKDTATQIVENINVLEGYCAKSVCLS